MRKLFALGITLAIAATLIGCKKKSEESSGASDNDDGDSREKIVQNFCEAFRLCDSSVLSEIMKGEYKSAYGSSREADFLTPLREMARSDKTVKTKVLISATIENTSGSIIEARCEGVDTLYFFVGYKYAEESKDKVDKILYMTADKEKVDREIRMVKELKSQKDKTRPYDVGGSCSNRAPGRVRAPYNYSSGSNVTRRVEKKAKSAAYARPAAYGPTNAPSKAYYK